MPADLLKQCKETKVRDQEIKESKEYKAGDGLLSYMRVMVAKENNGKAQEQTQKLLTFFGNENIHEILTYLSQYASQHQNIATPIHDACLFQLPIHQKGWKLTIWRQLAKKFHYEKWFMDLVPQARDIEKDPKFNNQIKKEELLQITADLIYTPDLVKQDPEAAYKLLNETLALGDENLPDLIKAIRKELIDTTVPLKFMSVGFTNM